MGGSERFLAEAHAISRLQHQNIVALYDFGEEEGQKFIAMQFILGSTLTQLIRSEPPMDFLRVVNIAKQICRGLKYAHENNVVHRDIKSGNIMMAAGDKAFISDFGIAKISDSPAITTTGMALGTPEYMAPEQCEGGAVDAQSDLYALGIVIYEMVSGKPPFLAETPLATAFKQVHDLPPLLGKSRSKVPPRLELIVAKCMKKKKDDRYKNADELLRDLDTVMSDSGPMDVSKSEAEQNLRITDRRQGDRRYLLAIAGGPKKILLGAVALLLIAGGMTLWQLRSSKPQDSGSQWLRPASATGPAARIWDGDPNTSWSPSSSKDTAEFDLGGSYSLQSLYLETGSLENSTPMGFPMGVEVSLDGSKPMRFKLEETSSPQILSMQGRVAKKLTLRFAPRNGEPSVVREARFLGLRYE